MFVRKDGKETGEHATVRTFMIINCSFDSSVGRAEDCRYMVDILRSLVRIRLEGLLLLNLSLLFFPSIV